MAALAASVFAAAGRGLMLPAADFRYGLWIAVGTLVLVFEMLGRRPDAQRPASSPAEVTP